MSNINAVNNPVSDMNPANVFRLKLEDLRGTNTEVLTIYLYELKNFINTHDLNPAELKLYATLYSSLQYYKEVSDPTTPFFQKLLEYTEKETIMLMKKYPNLSIKTSLRIKSPISAYNKIVDKIQQYIREGRDLSNLNSSLIDFIGVRRIVDLKDVLFENQKETTDMCYSLLATQLRISR
ncbi:MAG: hypothetical protein HFJ46_07640 [Clostridia bacterium]|nr:hypothetical protein [Clostridia bacterium]